MGDMTPTGPFLYLIIAFGICTAIFLGLLLWRSILTTHEDDQLFISGTDDSLARDQQQLISKITSLSKPILATGILAGMLLLMMAGMWLYEGLRTF